MSRAGMFVSFIAAFTLAAFAAKEASAGPAMAARAAVPALRLVVPVVQPLNFTCSPGYMPVGNKCMPEPCESGFVRQGAQCVCPAPKVVQGAACTSCPAGYHYDAGTCVKPPASCPPGFKKVGGTCVAPCPAGVQQLPDGQCLYPPPRHHQMLILKGR